MLHNYYLYEKGGRLAMFPWDYNDLCGTFWALVIQGEPGDATGLVNLGIDTPLLGVTPEQRPVWKWIAQDDNWLAACHQAMDAFLSRCFESGLFADRMDALSAMLQPYIEKDATLFYTQEQHAEACRVLKDFFLARAESVRRQLDGTLSTSTTEQRPERRVDASHLRIETLR